MVEAAVQLAVPIEELRIWGGGAKSAFWNQMAADIYGLPTLTTNVREAGLAGAAICAWVGIGLYPDMQEGASHFVSVQERYEPNLALKRLYDDLYGLHQSTYTALLDAGVFQGLSDL